ncbi:MAG: hypothetical protein OXG33_06245 [Chloroflexi bacterium]|nr:hypothetical protein [Chloroflexota bacterium]
MDSTEKLAMPAAENAAWAAKSVAVMRCGAVSDGMMDVSLSPGVDVRAF